MARKFKIESKKPKQKWKLFSYADDLIDTEMIRGPHIELFANREIIIDGCKGVFEYSDSYIKLNLTKGSLILCGNNFDIITFDNSTITIRGKISSLEFCV